MSELTDLSTLKPSTSHEINDSYVNVFGVDSIIAAAQETDDLVIYKSYDFKHPIMSVVARAAIQENDGRSSLILSSIISMDRSTGGRSYEWEEHFKNFFVTPIDLDENELKILSGPFPDIFRVYDKANDFRFVVEVNPYRSEISIGNNKVIRRDNECYEIDAPTIEDRAPLSQLESFGSVVALTTDFASTLERVGERDHTYKPRKLGKNYNFSASRNTVSDYRAQPIGHQAVHMGPANTAHDQETTKTTTDGISKWPLLSDFGGLDEAKQELKNIITAFRHPEIMKKWGGEVPNSVLLYGESSADQAMLARALAHELSAKFEEVECTNIYGIKRGHEGQQLKGIFEKARKSGQTTVLFINNYDELISPDRNKGTVADDVALVFKKEIQDLDKRNGNIVIVASAQDKDAVINPGDFDIKLYLPLPDDSARSDIIVNIISQGIVEQTGFSIFSRDIDVADLSEQTASFTGSDIIRLFKRLRVKKALLEARQHAEAGSISQADILAEIQNLRTE